MHRKCPRWSASCARTRPAHPGSRYKLLHNRVERLPQMPPHSKCCRLCVSLIHPGAHNLDLLLHRPSNPGAVLKRVVSKLPSADALMQDPPHPSVLSLTLVYNV